MAYIDVNKQFSSAEDITDYAVFLFENYPAYDNNQRARVVISYLMRTGMTDSDIADWITKNLESHAEFEEHRQRFLNWMSAVARGAFRFLDHEEMLNQPVPQKSFAQAFAEAKAKAQAKAEARKPAAE